MGKKVERPNAKLWTDEPPDVADRRYRKLAATVGADSCHFDAVGRFVAVEKRFADLIGAFEAFWSSSATRLPPQSK